MADMRRLKLTGGSKALFVIGLLAMPIGWLVVRNHLFPGSGEDIRDFLTGLGVVCLIGALVLAKRQPES